MPFNKIRRWCRVVHRDLSFFFAGMLLIYAISGIAMNHVRTTNPNYTVEQHHYVVDVTTVDPSEVTKDYVVTHFLDSIGQAEYYTKHYFPEEGKLKVFLKGGSNVVVDLSTGQVVFEEVKPRYVIGAMSRLHYNPGKWWPIFADLFAIGLIIITLTGLVMQKGKHGLWGIGGIELLVGAAIPLLFLFFY